MQVEAKFFCENDESDNCATGDVNSDGILNVVDLVSIVSYILETSYPTDEEQCISDMNFDDIINVVDIVEIISIILNEDL